MRDEERFNDFGRERISKRQIDELIGLSRGLIADGELNQLEAEFLQTWLAANCAVSGHPMIRTLYDRVAAMLADQTLDSEEAAELFETLRSFADAGIELGETIKSTTLPLCEPAPTPLIIAGQAFCFTGTFNYGARSQCEAAIVTRGGTFGGLTRKTNILVVGVYATESWKHSAFGNKILKAVDMREAGVPISIVSEDHWRQFL